MELTIKIDNEELQKLLKMEQIEDVNSTEQVKNAIHELIYRQYEEWENFDRECTITLLEDDKKEVKEMFKNAQEHLNGLKTEDDVISVCNHLNGFELIKETYVDDRFTIHIATDNTGENELQGIRVYLDKETMTLSKFIDVFFNNDNYPLEDYEVTE